MKLLQFLLNKPFLRIDSAVGKISARMVRSRDRFILRQCYEDGMKTYIDKVWGWDPAWQDKDFHQSLKTSATYVLENREARLIGYFQLKHADRQSDYLRMLILKPEVQSMGIGTQILSEIRQKAQNHGRTLRLRVFKVNSRAKRFYERNGWNIIADDDPYFLMENPPNTLSINPKQPQ